MKLSREFIAIRRAMSKGRKPRKREIPRQKPPNGAKLLYARELGKRVEALKDWTKERVIPMLQSLVVQREADLRLDASVSDLLRIFDEYTIFVARAPLESVALSVDKNSEEQHQSQMKAAIGIETITPTRATQAKISDFVDANTQLVKDFDADNLRRLRETVISGVNSAERVEGLTRRIEDTFGVARKRAALIARDQTLKLHGQLAETRQVSAGFEEYDWSTSGDQRVRDRHAQLNGTRQRWDKPPIVDMKTGRRAHPGQDYQCRCQAIPVVPEEWIETEASPAPPKAAEPEQARGTKPKGQRQPVPADVDKWRKSLPPSQAEAVDLWKGDDYAFFRQYQANGTTNPKWKERLSNFDKALEKAPKYTGQAYRGVHDLPFSEIGKLERGAVIEAKTSESWSPEEKIARRFVSGSEEGTTDILFRTVQKKVPWIDSTTGPSGESEVVPPIGTKYKVVSVSPLSGSDRVRFLVDLEVVE